MKHIFFLLSLLSCSITCLAEEINVQQSDLSKSSLTKQASTQLKESSTHTTKSQTDVLIDPLRNTEHTQLVIDLCDTIKIVEDDLDRLNYLDQSTEDIAKIRAILETKKDALLEKLSKYKGFERLANMSNRQHFSSKNDNTILLGASYAIIGIGISMLALSSINVQQKSVSIPNQGCIDSNIQALKGFTSWLASFT